MRDIFWNWRFFKGKLILEDESTKPERKNVPKNKKMPVPDYVSNWSQINNFNILPLSKDLYGYLGAGAQGKVYSMAKDGKEYAVKFSDPFGKRVDEEFDIIKKIKSLQDSDKAIKRHTVNIYDTDSFEWEVFDEKTGDMTNKEIYVYVVERLQPLTALDKQYFQTANIEKTTFLNNIFFNKGYKGWDKIRGKYKQMLNASFPNRLLAMYKKAVKDGKVSSYEDLEIVKEKINSTLDELIFAFDKARDSLTKEELEYVYIEPLEGPSFVNAKKLGELYAEKMLDSDPGKQFFRDLQKLFSNSIDTTSMKKILDDQIATVLATVFRASIPMSYDDNSKAEIDKFQYQQAGPMKSLNQALLRLKNKFGIIAYDLHDENVMKRGDDLVVSDLGFFRGKEQQSSDGKTKKLLPSG